MVEGHLVGVRIRRKKEPYAELYILTPDGRTVATRDYHVPAEFWLEPRSERAEQKTREMGKRVHRIIPGRHAELVEVEANPYTRGRIRSGMKGFRVRLFGSRRPFEAGYLIERFGPYTQLTTENGLQKISLPTPLQLRAAAYDLETDGLATDPKRAEKEILCAALASADGAEVFWDEKTIISRSFDGFSSYDIIFTWNGDEYDMPCLVSRAEIHGIPVKIGHGEGVAKSRVGKSGTGSVYRPSGVQFIDLMTFLPRIYETPTNSLNDARRVFLGKEPEWMDKSKLKELAEKNDPRLYELVRRDTEELIEICNAAGLPQALVTLSGMFHLFPDTLTRMQFADLADHYVQMRAYRHKGIYHEKKAVLARTGALPLEGMQQFKVQKFRYPPQDVRTEIGHHKGPLFKVDKRIAPVRIIIDHEQDFRRSLEAPVAWAAQQIYESVMANRSDGSPSERTTVARFLKSVGFHLPRLLMDRKYAWRNRELSDIVENEVRRYIDGLYSDWTYTFTHEPPEMPVEASDIEPVEGIVVFNGGYVYAKNGLPFARGIKLTGPCQYITEALREIFYAAAAQGKEGFAEKYREYTDRHHMMVERDKFLVKPSQKRQKEIRRLKEEYGIDAKEEVQLRYDICVRILASRVRPIADVYGVSEYWLAHPTQREQLSLI